MGNDKMEWQGHALLGLRAAQGLPAWEIAMLKPDMSPEAINRPYMPEIKSVTDKLGAFCLILDWIYQKEFSAYCRQPNGRWIPHGPATDSYGSALSLTTNVAIIEEMLQKMIAALRAQDFEEAVRHAGVIGHFLQEPFTPGHSVDNMLFEEFFPDPDPTRHIRLHCYFDCASGDFKPPKPHLMGRTIQEAATWLLNEVRLGIREAKKMIEPVVRSVYRGDPDYVRKALLCRQSEWASFITASAWHTAFCIAFDRFDSAETAGMDQTKLTNLLPFFWHPGHYTHLLPGCLVDNKGHRIPIDVWALDKNGNKTERRFEEGFGIYGHSGAKFYVNGVFSKLRFKLGMPSRKLDGQTEHADLHFAIEVDDKENTLFSEDIEYEAKNRVLELNLKAGETLREYEVDISGAKTLIISSRATPYTDEKGETRYSVPDLVIIEAVLIT